MDNDIPEFADVVQDRDVLDGDKIPIKQIFNLPLVFTGWEIANSKYPIKGQSTTERLTLQFLKDGVHRIAFSNSSVLIGQIKAFEEARDKSKPKMFRAVIRKIGMYYKFCRTTEAK